MATNGEMPHRQAIIGGKKNFWLYDSRKGFDLTHPETPSSPPLYPRLTLQTTISPIALDPAKTALVIIDMQNFFLSPALGRAEGAGHKAVEQLVEHAIPAARRAGIRIVWMNWGLTEQEIEDMPPSLVRTFGFISHEGGQAVPVNKYGRAAHEGGSRIYNGLGSGMGIVTDPESGKETDAGKMLMSEQWNARLYGPLDKIYQEGKQLKQRPDVNVLKSRMSGMWGPGTACEEVLKREGVKSLLFAGVNTDQCVGGTYQDCVSKGYDCILLKDGCGTTSPAFAQQCVQYNAENSWGFQISCKAFAEGVENMEMK